MTMMVGPSSAADVAAIAAATPPRRRTVSESPSPMLKSLLTPSVPLYLQQQQRRRDEEGVQMHRNASTPGFGRLARMSSSSGGGANDLADLLGRHPPPGPQPDHIVFGVDEGSQMMLRPSVLGERTALVRPMSRKDVFYGGSVLNLATAQARTESPPPATQLLNRYRHSVMSTPRSVIMRERLSFFRKKDYILILQCLFYTQRLYQWREGPSSSSWLHCGQPLEHQEGCHRSRPHHAQTEHQRLSCSCSQGDGGRQSLQESPLWPVLPGPLSWLFG